MAAQFDLFRTSGGVLVVVLQSDLLESMRTRVVAPLLQSDAVANAISTLNPRIEIDGRAWLLMPQLVATLTTGELGERVGSLAQRRDEITRAVDALLSGI